MKRKPKRTAGGRPPKFSEPRRPVTVTLPERTLAELAAINEDRARAIVKITDAIAGGNRHRFRHVELVAMAPGKSLIVVGPSRALKSIPGLKLIEIAPARYLVTIPSGTAVESLEVALHDMLNDPDVQHDEREHAILLELMNLIGHQRRTQRMSKAEILIIDSN
ncbi:MAG: hypothetical protein NT011_09375 [Kiritimatiellaeota bacterium]|nr:hypothetical protein [Kiritimatiellota bacterium]